MMRSVAFFGEMFEVRDSVSEFAMLEFAEAAADGEDVDSMQAASALLRLIRDVVTEDDWPRFRATARKNRAATKALMAVVEAAVSDVTERPTGRPSDSSDGPADTDPKSGSSVDAKVLERLLPGRPDKQFGIVRQQTG